MPAEGGGAAFALKRVWVNDKGWGPTPDNEPEQFKVSVLWIRALPCKLHSGAARCRVG
jgi:hypothetical protein